ncbi:uncharacterized protein LOC135213616 isoform X2 [Macrobrachium nipponense]|uniref:uncharacterized protein LOC135213616 isoform X2 n=1 Tax=Macrobrachium nipponense TaxID=159736 RepID=UPI0030C8811A
MTQLLLLFLTLVVSSHAEVLSSRTARGRPTVSSVLHGGRNLQPQPAASNIREDLSEQQDNIAEPTLFRHEVANISPKDKDLDDKHSSHKTSGLNSEKQINSLQPVPISVPLLLQSPNSEYFLPPHGTVISVSNPFPFRHNNNNNNHAPSVPPSNSVSSVSSLYAAPDVGLPLVGYSSSYGQTLQQGLPIAPVSVINHAPAGIPDKSHTGVTSSYEHPPHVDYSISSTPHPISISHPVSSVPAYGTPAVGGPHIEQSSYGQPSHSLEHSVSSPPVSLSVPEVGISGLYGTPDAGLSHPEFPSVSPSYGQPQSVFIFNPVASKSSLYGSHSANVPHNGLSVLSFGEPTVSENPISSVSISNPISSISGLYGTPSASVPHNGVSSSYAEPTFTEKPISSVHNPGPGISNLYSIPEAGTSNKELASSSYGQVPFSGSPVSHASISKPVPSVPSEYKSSGVGISQSRFSSSFDQPQISSYADPLVGSFVTTPSSSYLPPDIGASGSVVSPVSLPIQDSKNLHLTALNSRSSATAIRLDPPDINLSPTNYLTYAPSYPVGVKASTKTPAAQSQPAKSHYHSQDEFGRYAFGYNTGDSSRDETRDAYGHVRGSYSYVDANGEVQIQHYVADDKGFRVTGTNLPVHATDKN